MLGTLYGHKDSRTNGNIVFQFAYKLKFLKINRLVLLLYKKLQRNYIVNLTIRLLMRFLKFLLFGGPLAFLSVDDRRSQIFFCFYFIFRAKKTIRRTSKQQCPSIWRTSQQWQPKATWRAPMPCRAQVRHRWQTCRLLLLLVAPRPNTRSLSAPNTRNLSAPNTRSLSAPNKRSLFAQRLFSRLLVARN